MKNKKYFIISIIGLFLISFLAHFLYDWFPNKFTSIFFPVNESIWEHQKMTFTNYMLFGIIEYFLLKDKKINNFFFSLLISSIITILIVVGIFTPVFYLMSTKDNIFITLGIYLFGIIIGKYVQYRLLQKKEYKILNIISIILIPIIFTVFGILTYYPLQNGLFYDYNEQKYGLYSYYE